MSRTSEVEQMYQEYPFPNPVAGDQLILDEANGLAFLSPCHNLEGCSVLDAGCGTGHRLMALARTFPGAFFTGMDLTLTSLETAETLARRHGINNVCLVQHNLLEPLPQRYDVIISAGVVNQLEDPYLGLRNLCAALADNGFLMLWLYHKYGEFPRLLDRELALLFWRNMGRPRGEGRIEILRQLGLSLPQEQYGSASSGQWKELNQDSLDIDAYLHPIVNTYTFDEVFAMLRSCAVDWMAPNGMNWRHQSKLIDLGETCSEDPFFVITADDLFQDERLRAIYRKFRNEEKIAAAELVIRPTGFTVLAGKNQSYHRLEPRISMNLMKL